MAKQEKKAGPSDNPIGELRNGIDEINEKILDLINQRLLLGQRIGKIKAQNGSPVLDKDRETQVINRITALNKGPLKNETLRHLFSEIIAASREVQQPQQISFFGPEATFTHIAAKKHFGHSVSFDPQPSIRDVFSEVERGASHYGVVPVENSSEGAVNHTLDLFFESDLRVCAEIYQTISHDLLSTTGTLEGITEIYSHPQPFGQCREWLRKHVPDCTLTECSSTAQAAKEAAEKPGSAAIASSEAADMYNLRVVASAIEDISRNTTRFLVIGKDAVEPTGRDKTSLMFVTAHIPGALYKVLEPIAEAGINLLKLESRPTKFKNWNYCFFVDLEGHMDDDPVGETVKRMKSTCQYLKWLGSYPRSQDEDL